MIKNIGIKQITIHAKYPLLIKPHLINKASIPPSHFHCNRIKMGGRGWCDLRQGEALCIVAASTIS